MRAAKSRRPYMPGLDLLEPRALMSRLHLPALDVSAEVSKGDKPSKATRAHVLDNLVYNRRGEHLDLYIPGGRTPADGRPIILLFEGGGWQSADRQPYGRAAAAAFGKAGFIVASADYSFSSSGFSSWPTSLEDCRDAVRWLKSRSAQFGGDPNRIVAMGESAGGHLASLVGLYPDGPVAAQGLPADPERHDPGAQSARVQAVVDFYGPSDLVASYNENIHGRQFVVPFVGGTPLTVPGRYQAASPISHVTPDDPPFLILQGANDPGVPPHQSSDLAAALDAVGVTNRLEIIPHATHGFKFRAGGRNLVPLIVGFLRDVLGTGSSR